jgi:hypothetical protein
LIHGEGLNTLNGITTHEEADQGNSWATPSLNDDTYYYDWRSAPPVLTFQFDKVYFLDGLMVWNYATPNMKAASNSAKSITLEFDDSVHQTSICYTPPDMLVKGHSGESAQVITFPRAFRADRVIMTITDNWHDSIGVGDRVALSEVRFLAPEPGSFLLLLILGASTWLIRCGRAFFRRVF